VAGDDPLSEYERKRDFGRTPEPPESKDGRGRRGGAGVSSGMFVVHRHDASRLHWDLRLEVQGALRSWAVPKGFSYDPGEKHLAVRTEDHPLAYEDFDGVIPKGQYGAGTMTIWDRGNYALAHGGDWEQADRKGEVKLLLFGRRLRGEWHLVRTKQGEGTWLLFKSRDVYAGPARDSALGVDLADAPAARWPRSSRAMLPTEEAGGAFSHPDWLFEAELEGRRTFARKDGDRVRFVGVRRALPELERGLARLRAGRAVLDGILVAHDEGMRPRPEQLAARLAGKGDAELVYYAFDLLHWEDYDLRGLPLVERKGALRALLPEGERIAFLDHVPGKGEGLADVLAASGLPALWARRARAPYVAGASPDWKRVPVRAARGAHSADLRSVLAPASRSRARFTNVDKTFWPAEGYTKGDLIAHYDLVAPLLLPHLADRPVHMNRFPDGIEGKSFYQRQAKADTPDWVRTVVIPPGPGGEDGDDEDQLQLVCDDRETLLWLANQGSIDLHPWLSRVASLDSPDWAVIDLDPKEAPFRHVVRIAREVGEILHALSLRPLLKTSGASGLHVYVPLRPGYDYEQARMFCEAVARIVVHRLGKIATVERAIGNREGKVYVDFGQNRRSQTVVPPYVPRPVRGATVSTPLEWGELDDDLHPSRFTIQTIRPRLEERGDLFRAALDDPQDLGGAIEALPRLLE